MLKPNLLRRHLPASLFERHEKFSNEKPFINTERPRLVTLIIHGVFWHLRCGVERLNMETHDQILSFDPSGRNGNNFADFISDLWFRWFD